MFVLVSIPYGNCIHLTSSLLIMTFYDNKLNQYTVTTYQLSILSPGL